MTLRGEFCAHANRRPFSTPKKVLVSLEHDEKVEVNISHHCWGNPLLYCTVQHCKHTKVQSRLYNTQGYSGKIFRMPLQRGVSVGPNP